MKKLLLIVLILFACEDPASPKDACGVPNGSGYDCDGKCGENIQLWDNCVNIQTTTNITYYNNGYTGEIPEEIGQSSCI